MEYFVVMCDYGDDGLEAIVDPALTRAQIVARIKSREFDNIVQIDRICFAAAYDTVPQRVAEDVTKDLIDEAEAELAEPFGEDVALPASIVPPVR
jgi:hypothetical protein